MKKNLTFALAALAALTLCSLQKTNAQAWKIGGNAVLSDTTLGTTSNYDLNFITDNIVRMSIASGGRIAFGTNLVNRARITTDGTVGHTLAIFGNSLHGISLVNDVPSIGFNNYYAAGWKVLNDGYSGLIAMDNTVGNIQFATCPNALKDAVVTPSVRMIIAQNGNVGIGTTSPSSTLHVAGNQTLAGNLTFTAGTQSIQFANPGASPAPMMYMFSSGTTNTTRMVIAHSPGFPTWGLQYADNGDQFDFLGAGTSRMSINLSNGNVGIGVPSPAYRLEVCGTIRAKEVRVETGWCDYVFGKDYKLRSIDELEKFINDNKHLPGIAPASDVEKDGLKVGEMNKAMMEKIEELTLYVIQLSKENKQLQSEIDALKK
jgi:hypothetical protein